MTEIMLDELVGFLSERLKRELPGREAQEMMIPPARRADVVDEQKVAQARPAGALILLYPVENDLAFPLIKRPVYNGVHSGQVSLPGGKRDLEDKSLIETALRECSEEIGVGGETVQTLGILSDLFVPVSRFLITPVVGFVRQIPAFIPDDYEVERMFSGTLKELVDPKTIREGMIRLSSGYEMSAPYFNIAGEVVWGATAMILSELKWLTLEFFEEMKQKD